MNPDDVCEFREWDSEFFGVRIGRLHATRLTRELNESVEGWCRARRIECLYFLADPDDRETVRVAEAHGYSLVDVRIMLERSCENPAPASQPPTGVMLRDARSADIPTLRAIAKVSHRNTRFHCDGRFPAECCDNLYEVWIEKSCCGYADRVFVAELDGQVAGYITCGVDERRWGTIGLVGVSAAARGHGVGPALVESAVHWTAQKGLERITVVTQARNRAAQRMYERCGFLTRHVQLWYHRWFD